MNNKARVTVLLMNYKRERNLPIIIDSLKSQTIACNIFLWNNAEEEYKDDRLDLVINSSKNLKCWPRWSMAAYAETEYVMSHDDDLCFNATDALEKLIECHQKHEKPGLAIGFNGVKLGSDLSYYPSSPQKLIRKIGITLGVKHVKFPKKDTPVDVVKGRMIFCKREDIRSAPMFADHNENCDDIIISSALSQGEQKHHIITCSLNGKIGELPGGKDGFAVSQKTDWKSYRTEVTRKYFTST
ncbi:MAG: glycosyltransferase family 2 protein [Cyclobacteriaceae bacterium]